MTALQFCLGSASPRRAQLLGQLGYRFKILAADIDECRRAGEPAEVFVRRLAEEKGAALQEQGEVLPILAADTIVVLDGEVLGKPDSMGDAKNMLLKLSGRSHDVLTAIALSRSGRDVESKVQRSRVSFAALSETWIDRYIATGEPMDKAGAYGIQGFAGTFVKHLEGSYTGVMGLPLFETAALLAGAGIHWAPLSDYG